MCKLMSFFIVVAVAVEEEEEEFEMGIVNSDRSFPTQQAY